MILKLPLIKTHNPYLVRYEIEDDERREFIGESCATDMLNNLPNKKNILFIARNANYDCRFLLNHLSQEKVLVKGSRILSCNAVYFRYGNLQKPINIQINDISKVINMPLRIVGKSSKLNVENELRLTNSIHKKISKKFTFQYMVRLLTLAMMRYSIL